MAVSPVVEVDVVALAVHPAGLRVAAVRGCGGLVQRHPAVEAGAGRKPREPEVVAVAHGDDPPRDAGHLAQRLDRVGDVLQHLVRVHDVERRVGEVERVHVADRELDRDAGRVARVGARGVEHLVGAVDAHDAPGRDPLGEVDGDRARSAPDQRTVGPNRQSRANGTGPLRIGGGDLAC